jgi:hypothetical protein
MRLKPHKIQEYLIEEQQIHKVRFIGYAYQLKYSQQN